MAKTDLNDLLKHFDEETSQRLSHLVADGSFTVDHVKDLIRLTSKRSEYRDAEALDSVLEDAEEMDAPAFKAWVDHIIKEGQ